MVQEPSEALASVENALRLIVRTVLGDSWTSQLDEAKLAKLAIKKEEDSTRRDGAVIADDLLAYTELYQLKSFVISDWEKFKPVFDDKKRTRSTLASSKTSEIPPRIVGNSPPLSESSFQAYQRSSGIRLPYTEPHWIQRMRTIR